MTKLFKKMLVLFALATMVITGGCGDNTDTVDTFYSDKAAMLEPRIFNHYGLS